MADNAKLYKVMATMLCSVGKQVGEMLAKTVKVTPENPVKLYSDMYLISKGHILMLDQDRAEKRRLALHAKGKALGWTTISARTYEHECANGCGVNTVTTFGTWYPEKGRPTVCPVCNRVAYINASESLNPAKADATKALDAILSKTAAVSKALSAVKKSTVKA